DEVAYRIEQENYQREQDSQIYNIPFDRIDGVTRALAIQYILTYTDSDMVFQKASIRVLELQPCYDFTYAAMDYLHPQVTVAGRGNEARISAFKKEILGMSDEEIAKGEADPNYGIQVEIVGMTTSEFCGHIEDINVEYDMIYWGSNIGTFNKCLGTDDQKMHTVFNDYDMIGNVYTHVGDVSFQWPNEHILGLLDVNSITQSNHKDVLGWIGSNRNAYLSKFYRYSGNDILATQVDKLVSFLDAGYPIIVADDFFVDGADAANYPASFISSSDTVVSHGLTLKSYGEKDASWLASNASQPSKDVWGILDTSSYVYQFVNEIVSARDLDAKKYQNFMTVSQTTASEEGKRHFSTALNRPKIQINMISQPIEYTYSEVPVSGVSVIDAANSLAPEGDGKYYLEYEFYISNASGTSSTGATYGAKLYVDANMDGKYVSDELMALSDVVNLDANLVVPVNSLQDGTYYRIRRELPKEYIGAVPWKLEILDVSNQNVRGSVEGLSAVKEEKRELYICQFVQNRGGGADYTFIGENKVDGFRTRSGAWTALLQAVPDFNIHVISVDANDYFQTNGSLSDDALRRKYNRLPENVSYNPDIEYDPDVVFDPSLEGYDMLMFGFTEGFLENNSDTDKFGNQVNMGRVMRFIQSEKSVLFTHDTTAAFNRTSNNNSFNILIRDMGGMDRYGITIGKGTYDGQNPIEKEVFNQNKMRRGLVQATSKEELEDKLLFNGLMSDYKRDIAFKPGTNQTTMASETIALTASAWDSARRNTSGSVLYRAYDYDSLGVNRAYYGTYGRYSEGTKRVSKVNSGAITEYPYKLDDIIPISTTHGQYYQLDMDTDKDGDGEGDMVVWYTIENYHSSLDGYNISPHDVRNNYYIFTKDNITYSGSGDTRVEAENEIKLFINTMVAAYRVGTKAPDINLVSDPNTMMIKTADSIPYDPDVYDSAATYPVYFQVKDNNLLADDKKKVYYKAYLVDQSGSQSINLGTTENPKNINVTEITQNPTYAIHVGNQVGTASLPGPYGDYGYNIVNEEVYRIDLPLSLFTTQDVIELYIEGRSEIEKKQKTVTSEAIFTKYTISKMQLFDMD
ncbi:MAG: DUF5057 domain-containing protein, partial [Lachnospiraceae bacterium]|nr:DUF5057 domain-containing protein [Lachnospiraceae bacterium]